MFPSPIIIILIVERKEAPSLCDRLLKRARAARERARAARERARAARDGAVALGRRALNALRRDVGCALALQGALCAYVLACPAAPLLCAAAASGAVALGALGPMHRLAARLRAPEHPLAWVREACIVLYAFACSLAPGWQVPAALLI